jgi:hypothetical protein
MTRQKCHCPSNFRVLLTVVSVSVALLHCWPSDARGSARDVLDRFQHEACDPYQADFDRITAAARGQTWVRSLNRQLGSIDKITESIISDLEFYRAEFAQHSLASLGGNPTGKQRPAAGALKILRSSPVYLGKPLGIALDNSSDQATIQNYIHAYINSRIRYVDLYSQTVASTCTNNVRECIRLCMVLRFLRTPDADWTSADTAETPQWIRPVPNLQEVETFSLQTARLITAFQFHMAQSKVSRPSDDGTEYASYLGRAAGMLMQMGDMDGAAACLERGIQFTAQRGLPASGEPLRLQLADLLSEKNSPKASAQIRGFIGRATSPEERSKEVVFYLKSLYVNDRFKEEQEAANGYKDDSQCQSCLPQILYMGWVAARQDPSADGADGKWQKEFLTRFPDHPLGADIYFADAMNSLANGNYGDARQKLQFIEYHYPDATILPKVKEIETRLTAVSDAH